MNVALYIRVSTEEQAREGLSLEVQEEACRQRALHDGATSLTTYCDDGYSATNTDRPALQRLLADLPNLDAVYVYDQSRLARDQPGFWALVSRLTSEDVGLVCVTQDHDLASDIGRMTAGILGAVDEYEVRRLRAKSRAALRQRVQSGLKHSHPVTGYDYERDDRGEVVHNRPHLIVPGDAELVRGFFEAYDSGSSLTQIAKQGNVATGTPKPRWNSSRIRQILINPYYIGKVRFGDELWDGLHEALIPLDLWRRVQRRLREEAAVHPHSRNSSFGSLMRCGVCGGPVVVSKGGRDGYRSYLCQHRRQYPKGDRHPPIACGTAKADAIIWAWTGELVTTDRLEKAARRYATEHDAKADVERQRLTTQAAELEERIVYNVRAAAEGALPLDMLTEQNAPLVAERERLLSLLGRAPEDGLTPADLETVQQIAEEGLEGLVAEATMSQQREFLGHLYDHIELHKRQLVFHHRLDGLAAKTVQVPAYYSAARGCVDLDLA